MLIPPYGETLINRFIGDDRWQECMAKTRGGTIHLSHEDQIHLFNIATGCYSPLTGFMTEQEYHQVIDRNKLSSGLDWTIPILLRVDRSVADSMAAGSALGLLNAAGETLAVMEIESVFAIDREEHNARIFRTGSHEHPGVQDILKKSAWCLGGPVHVLATSVPALRYWRSPLECRTWLENTGKKTFTAFSTRNICHLGHEYLQALALEITDMLGINVITGAQVKGSFLPDVIFDTYDHIINSYYPVGRVFINNLRLPPIYAGPKEAFLQATILQNYGFTHFIVGRDHAGIGNFYTRYASQQIFRELTDLSIQILPISEPRFCKLCHKITTENSCRHSEPDIMPLNGRDVRRFLLEKRYTELRKIIREDLQKFLVDLFEERVHFAKDAAEPQISEPRKVFYD
jgi:sulfate adenylyltransferase